nr:hypothetical protein Iba_chr03bCG0360 [Ipomoea batatas]
MSIHGLFSLRPKKTLRLAGVGILVWSLAKWILETLETKKLDRDSMLRAKSSNVNKSAERISWSTGSRTVIGAKDTLVQVVSVQFGSLEPLVSRKLGSKDTVSKNDENEVDRVSIGNVRRCDFPLV